MREADLTLILLVRERVQYVERFLNFHQDFRIIVADSSERSHADLVKSADNIEYHWFGPCNHFKKILAALDFVQTRYAMVVNDDDFFIASGIRDCMRILENTPGAICVHGASVNFEERPYPNIYYRNHKTLLRNWSLGRRKGRANAFDRFDRSFRFVTYGPYNAVFRAADLREAVSMLVEFDLTTPGPNDFGFVFVVGLLGDFLGSRELYCLRNLDAPPVRDILNIPISDPWGPLLAAEKFWSTRVHPERVRRAIPIWKSRIARQAKIERMIGRFTDRLFPLGAFYLLRNYRRADALLKSAISCAPLGRRPVLES